MFVKNLFKLLTIVVLLPFVFSFSREPENLVINSGFEKADGSNPADWIIQIPRNSNSCKAGIDNSEFHSGSNSYKISEIWTFPRRSTSLKTEKPIPIDPGKNYLFSFWYKTGGIHEYPIAFRAQFYVECENTPSVTYGKLIPNTDDWQQYFMLLDNTPHDAKTIEVSFNTIVNTRGSIWIDDIEFSEASEDDIISFEQWRRQSVPEITGKTDGRKFKATGFYRVEKGNDRWWLVDPNGYPTWAIAIDGTKRPARALGEPETGSDWVIGQFGSTPGEINEKMYSIFMDECGFNAFAGWSADEYGLISKKRLEAGEPYMPMTKVLGLAGASRDRNSFAKDRDGNLLDGGHAVPDPFNPQWKKAARERAERVIPAYRDEPWFLGWYVDNEMSFAELYRYIWAEFSAKEFIKVLEEKYKTIDALNQAWSSSSQSYLYSSFSDILLDKPEPKEWNDPLWADFAVFERHMLSEYINYTYNLVKELDPNHLIISNRINLDPMPEVHRTIDLWGKYDIVCMNIYPDNNKIGFNEGEIEIMKKLYQGTGRPVMIGEWSVPSIDSGLYKFGKDSLDRPLDWSWPQVLRTQKERGEAYEMCIKQLASLDFMIGAGWFITFDVNTAERRANRGIMNTNYELYHDLTDAMHKANNDIKKKMELPW